MEVYELKLKDKPFESIKNKSKTIEMRLFDEKRSQFKVGDILIFKKVSNESETLTTKILALHKFKNFEELYKNFNKKVLGYAENENASYLDMQEYYPLEKQKQYGVVGIEIELI